MSGGGVLFIAQYFPPRPAAAGRRLGFLAAAAARECGRVFVIRGDRGYAGPEQAGVEVIAIPLSDLRSVAGGASPAGTVAKTGWRHRLVSPLARYRQAFPLLYLSDDGGPAWRRAAYRAGRELIERHAITTVFSSFRPWSDHLVARRLKADFPQLRWIADFRDLPVDPVRRDVGWPALQRWWGRRVVRSADELWCVSRGQAAQLADCHPRVRVRYNPLLAPPPAATAPVTERFTIVYTGSLYPGLQTVAPLARALAELITAGELDPADLLLRYRGRDGALFKQWCRELPGGCLDVSPSVAPAAAQRLQREAQLLLLLNWSAPGYYGVLTAKLWDYLATGRPVLALVNGPGDAELADIIGGAGAGAVFTVGEAVRLREWVAQQYREWRPGGTVAWAVRPGGLARFQAEKAYFCPPPPPGA